VNSRRRAMTRKWRRRWEEVGWEWRRRRRMIEEEKEEETALMFFLLAINLRSSSRTSRTILLRENSDMSSLNFASNFS